MKALAALICLMATAAHAEPVCLPHSRMVAVLDERFSERHVVTAREDRGSMVEVFVSAKGTWTMVMVDASLNTCILATGESWMQIAVGELR